MLECVPDDPVHAFVGVDLFLDRNLVCRSSFEATPDIDVQPFGVFAEYDEVYLVWTAIL